MGRAIHRSSLLVAGLLFAVSGQAHAQGVAGASTPESRERVVQPLADQEMVEMATRACYERITGSDRVLPEHVSIQNVTRDRLRMTVYGVVQQPAPGGPMAFSCMVSGAGGTGGSAGQVFSLQYSRIEESG